MKNLDCAVCCWYWQEEDEARPICHYPGPSCNAPCEWDDKATLDEILSDQKEDNNTTTTNDAKKTFIRQMARADDTLLTLSAYLGDLEYRRKNEDTWGDVGTLTHLADKLEEIYQEFERYIKRRTED
jgi:hypothetical protein